MKRPCLDCGELTSGSRCDDCAARAARIAGRGLGAKARSKQRGYTSQWRRLSKQARALQPFCLDCGTRSNLTADHKPVAWWRYEQGLAVRLEDVDVVCDECNRKRGPARPGSRRYRQWERERSRRE